MTVDFFEHEIARVQDKFNQTFGSMPLCNPEARINVIFAIVQMCILQRKISTKKQKEDISRFVRIRDKLNEIFSTLIKETERRQHAKRSKNQESGIDKQNNGPSRDRNMQGLQKRL